MNIPTIQPATSADFPSITAIAHATWPSTFGAILSEQQIGFMLQQMYSPASLAEQVEKGHRFLLLTENAPPANHPLAYISYELDYLPNVTKIHKLYALPAYQGKGYGRLLIEQVASLAKAAQQQQLRLDVNYKNPAIGFYQHLGFQIIARQDTPIGQGFLMEDYVMEKPL